MHIPAHRQTTASKSPGLPRRVVVIQPYVPSYRTPFYDRVHSLLGAEGVTLEVLHGTPPPGQSARRDAATCVSARRVPARWLPVPGGRSLALHRVQQLAATADAVVLEQALRNLETYPLLLKQRFGRTRGHRPRVAFWGHGRTYTKPVSRFEAAAKDALTRRADWFFAYTDLGAEHVTRHGFPRDRITVLRNSVDTKGLVRARERAEEPGTPEFAEAAALRERHRLIPGLTALFIGGLDAPKRVPFLLEAAERIAAALPGFRLLVAGDGTDRGLVEAAASRPGSPVVPVGQAGGQRLAVLGAVSDVMLMPGRVGLCAVDSFALRTPVVTTVWPWHAPEFEYLENGRNSVITPDAVEPYAAAVTELLADRAGLDALRAACRSDAAEYSIEEMSERFCEGALRLLGL
ncbi:glycosyltransferase family 4 protein [Streptomyces sp. NPDC002078]